MRYAIRFLLKNKIISLLIIIQLAAVITSVVLMASVYKYKRNMYEAVRSWFTPNSAVARVTTYEHSLTKLEAKYRYEGVEEVYAVPFDIIRVDDENNIEEYSYNVYSKELYEAQHLMFSSGDGSKLFEKSENYCIAAGKGFKVGQRIIGEISEQPVELTVAAVISDNQQLIAEIQGVTEYHYDYRDFYKLYDTSVIDRPLIIVSEQCAERIRAYGCIDHAAVKFKDKESMEASLAMMMSDGCTFYGSGDEFWENSEMYIRSELYIILPIVVCVFVICLFAAVSTAALSVLKSRRNYAVFFLNGATAWDCIRISTAQSIISAALSAVLAFIAILISSGTLIRTTVINFDRTVILICAGIIGIYVLCSMIMPFTLINSTRIKESLKED